MGTTGNGVPTLIRISAKNRTDSHIFVDSEDANPIPPDLRAIASAVSTIPITSADSGRGFSARNIIAAPLRSRLGVSPLSNLIFVNLVGPPLNHFNPKPYVKK